MRYRVQTRYRIRRNRYIIMYNVIITGIIGARCKATIFHFRLRQEEFMEFRLAAFSIVNTQGLPTFGVIWATLRDKKKKKNWTIKTGATDILHANQNT